MDVKCERCNTEYEFDDALVSGRGTTVKCTNCGHKFKIRRNDGDFSEDFWNITTGDGRTLVFTSLRELQRAIQGYLVERNDRLSRGGLPPKAIGQIPELAPFFEQREAAKKTRQSARGTKTTQGGLGPAADAHESVRPRQATKPEFPAPPADAMAKSSDAAGKTTLVGTGPSTTEVAFRPEPTVRVGVVVPAPAEQRAAPHLTPHAPIPERGTNTVPLHRPMPPPAPATAATSDVPVPTEGTRPSSDTALLASEGGTAWRTPKPPRTPPNDSIVSTSPPAPIVDLSSPLPPAPRVQRSLLAEIEEDRDRMRGPSASDPDSLQPKRRSGPGFIVATVVAGCMLMLGALWAQKNLGASLGTKPAAPTLAADPRVATFLSNGEKALADGNLELAKESFDKASALAEKDPHVLLALARLAAVRADVVWLKSRLLPADATDDHRMTRDSLNELATGAAKAADDALAVAPDNQAALRAKIDAARIGGDLEGARSLVGRISSSSAQPETGYVLAALDLAEAEPLWPTVIERLKVASAAETGPGRGRAALVFALARSGDVQGAKAEVDRLNAMPKAHPLLPVLRTFVDRTKLDAGAPAMAKETPDAGGGGRASGSRGGSGGGGGAAASTDPRELVTQGERARARGDYDRARTFFSAALERNPNDSEALAGLAAIAYAQHDLNGARASYKRVIAINPNYLPAVVGLADVAWDSGDKTTASRMYKEIVDRYPEGAYPPRVKGRADGGG